MIIRIVKMTFKPESIPDFLEDFEKNKRQIRTFKGCRKLELLRDVKDANVLFTYSYWKSEDDLNAYRQSEFFGSVWKVTKTYFSGPPEAWSVERIAELP